MLRRYRGEALWAQLHVAQDIIVSDMYSSALKVLFSNAISQKNKRNYTAVQLAAKRQH